MKKRLVCMACALAAVSMLAGCTKTTSKTTETTTSVTDENGNTTTTTTTTSTVDGKTETTQTTETTNADSDDGSATIADDDDEVMSDIAFSNETTVDIYGLYFSATDLDEWGDNLVDPDDPLLDGYTVTYHEALLYDPDVKWDLLAVDSEDGEIEFNDLDLSQVSDSTNITITLMLEDDGTFTATVE